ncbi:hypothetical protein G5I_04840 [Acromyrmex echinatior]|uniref:DUF8207 domain-containing protein n=1 Tax=Acromyrmex echinatior TaxID=103372 RepID=F4WGQ0_ACREC|nr:hypothetical protein G5I_04840 [Acromyrmex echinatior]
MALDKHFKPIIKLLRQIVDSSGVRAIKRQSRDDNAASASKCERKEEEEEEEGEGEKASETFERSTTPHKFDDQSHDCVQPITSIPYDNRINENQGQQTLQAGLGPLGLKYIEAVLRGARNKQKNGIDYVYGVYLHKDGLMFGNKLFDVDDADNIIIDGERYIW